MEALKNAVAVGKELIGDENLSEKKQSLVDKAAVAISEAVRGLKAPTVMEVTDIAVRQTAEAYVGETVDLNAKAYPSTAVDKTLVYESSKPEVAEVDKNGDVYKRQSLGCPQNYSGSCIASSASCSLC